jgi:hypothetical protein
MNKEQLAESREVDYRLSKWIITNIEQLLSPEEIEEIWRELLSFYSPPTASVENVCGTMTGNGLGEYVVPYKSDMIVDEFDDYDKTVSHYWLCPDCKRRVIAEYEEKHSVYCMELKCLWYGAIVSIIRVEESP